MPGYHAGSCLLRRVLPSYPRKLDLSCSPTPTDMVYSPVNITNMFTGIRFWLGKLERSTRFPFLHPHFNVLSLLYLQHLPMFPTKLI